MKQQKGFSLIEVLASLLLVTTLSLSLVQQQWQSKQVLTQLLLREQGSQVLDQIDEALLARANDLPALPEQYHLHTTLRNKETLLRLSWLHKNSGIIRKHIQNSGG